MKSFQEYLEESLNEGVGTGFEHPFLHDPSFIKILQTEFAKYGITGWAASMIAKNAKGAVVGPSKYVKVDHHKLKVQNSKQGYKDVSYAEIELKKLKSEDAWQIKTKVTSHNKDREDTILVTVTYDGKKFGHPLHTIVEDV